MSIATCSRWSFSAVLFIIVMSALAGCATPREPDIYKGYEGLDQPESQVATVQTVSAYLSLIDGKSLDHPDPEKFYNQAKLLPGRHTIRWGREFGISLLVDPSGFATYERSARIRLEPGHVYTLHADRTTGRGYRAYLWIEDATTGQVVAGEKLY